MRGTSSGAARPGQRRQSRCFECMCGNVICGRFDPSKPFFTARGSFWTNCTTELLASTTEADRQARTRNRCNGEGYESVALIALRWARTVRTAAIERPPQRPIHCRRDRLVGAAGGSSGCGPGQDAGRGGHAADGRGPGPLEQGPGAVRLRGLARPARSRCGW